MPAETMTMAHLHKRQSCRPKTRLLPTQVPCLGSYAWTLHLNPSWRTRSTKPRWAPL